jgi:D-methionine transport system substrate-binding protein
MLKRDFLRTSAAFLLPAAAGTFTSLADASPAATPSVIRVGVRGGVDEEIWEIVTQEARQRGLKVKPVVLGGAVSPNEGLHNGDLEANSFQHLPFLRDQNQQRGYQLVSAGNTYISPVAFYSKKFKRLQDLTAGARVGIPNDPSNQTRALVVLRDQGLLELRPGFDPFTDTATLADVTALRQKVELVEAASVVLARSLDDLATAAVINSFAYQLGLVATRDGIAVEKRERNPYVNLIAVRARDQNTPWARQLVAAYQSEPVRQFILNTYQGSVIPAF